MGSRGSSSRVLGTSGVTPTSDGSISISDLENMTYHYFTDKVSGTHEYSGSDRHVVNYMRDHTNSFDVLDSLSEMDRRAFRAWTRGYFMDGTQYLGWDKMSATDRGYTRAYDKAIDQVVLDRGITSVRLATPEMLGIGRRASSSEIEARLNQLSHNDSETLVSRGHMSSGLGAHGLTIGQSGKTVEYRYHFPAGSRGAGMWVGDSRINSWGSRQREFMINRDTGYKVGKWNYDSDRGVYVVNMYYVGTEEHNYGS